MQTDRKSIAVLDANAFISMGSVINLSTKAKIVTTEDVLGELKDEKTKEFVDSLPFEIETKDCDEKAIALVKQFAKKTGDIASLSQIDMELIAITYTLYKKEGLEGLLRSEPPPILEKEDLLDIAEANELDSSEQSDYEEQTKHEDFKQSKQQDKNKDLEEKKESQTPKEQLQEANKQKTEETQQDDGWITVPAKPKRKVSSSSSDDDDEEGWITTKNYEKKMAQMTSSFKEDLEQQPSFNIWLVSADFAIQNVAVQMGIKLLSLDGRRITSIRRFIYQCYVCWKKYRIHDEKVRLCSNCGYNSLSKIAYSIDQKGHMVLHRKKGWKPNMKILQVKDRKLEEQERKKKHQHARRKKKPSIFEN